MVFDFFMCVWNARGTDEMEHSIKIYWNIKTFVTLCFRLHLFMWVFGMLEGQIWWSDISNQLESRFSRFFFEISPLDLEVFQFHFSFALASGSLHSWCCFSLNQERPYREQENRRRLSSRELPCRPPPQHSPTPLYHCCCWKETLCKKHPSSAVLAPWRLVNCPSWSSLLFIFVFLCWSTISDPR